MVAFRGLLLLCCLHVGVALEGQAVCAGGAGTDQVAAAAGLNLTNKIAIVTGGDGDLGRVIVQAFALQKATVIIATHNLEKGTKAAEEIASKTGGDVRAMKLDLASFASVRKFAGNFLKKFDGKLHYLINNAGLGGIGFSSLTEDGYELTFQVNYLGHFLLSELLLPALRKERPSRIVNVASTAHVLACQAMNWGIAIPPSATCMKDWQRHLPLRRRITGTQPWYPHYFRPGQSKTIYGVTKLLQIEHAAELAKREQGSGPEVYSICPGLINGGLGPEVEALCNEQWINPPGVFRQSPCPYTPQVGAAVIAFAALHSHSEMNGKWLVRNRDCDVKAPFLSGFPSDQQSTLYESSLAWAGLKSGNFSDKLSMLV